jgi:hypothetical protein
MFIYFVSFLQQTAKRRFTQQNVYYNLADSYNDNKKLCSRVNLTGLRC